jgi:hypothetical protein
MVRGVAIIALFAMGCGAINIGDLPPSAAALSLLGIDDGTAGDRRLVSLGQVLRVSLEVTNRGGTRADNVVPRLLLRLRSSGTPVEATATPVGAPTSIAPRDTVAMIFSVEVPRTAPTGEWVVSARVDADRGGTGEAPQSLWRTWLVQRPAELRLVRLATIAGNTSFGYTSINPGCPVQIAADVHNAGEAAAVVAAAQIGLEGPEPLLSTALVGWEPEARIPGGGGARAFFRLEAKPEVVGGAAFFAGLRLQAADANSEAPAPFAATGVEPVNLVASAARVEVLQMSPTRLEVRPGQTGVALGARAAYFPGPTSAHALERVAVDLHFSRGDAWRVTPSPENPVSLAACDPAPCEGTGFSFVVDVPAALDPGPLGASLAISALDRIGGATNVVVCGASGLETSSKIEVVR